MQEDKTNDDCAFICGAEAIASELKIRVKQVYYLADLRRKNKTKFPVWREAGIGLVTTKRAIKDYQNSHIEQVA